VLDKFVVFCWIILGKIKSITAFWQTSVALGDKGINRCRNKNDHRPTPCYAISRAMYFHRLVIHRAMSFHWVMPTSPLGEIWTLTGRYRSGFLRQYQDIERGRGLYVIEMAVTH
jgi:hypothetical protein